MNAPLVEAPRTAPRGLRHVPGLEGIRGTALIVLVLYHGGFPWIRGALFSVSTFFTLSGYLITTLLRNEFHRTNHISFRRFWTGRARRLLPAALLTLLAILVVHRGFAGIAPTQIRGDVLAALNYVENWWLIHTDQTYGAVFGQSSPLQHFWSLAIEEQFYLLLPLTWLGLHRVFRTSRSVAIVFAAGALASFTLAAATIGTWGFTRVYFGTDTRAGELLVGVALAYVVNGHQLDLPERGRRLLNSAAFVSLGVLALLWWRVGLTDWFTFHGGTALNAIATAVIILACLQKGGVTSFMEVRLFRWLGRLSYTVYLVDWPLFLLLDPKRVHLGHWPLFALRMVLTISIAVLVNRFIELPIRRRTLLPGVRFGVVAIVMTTAIIAGSLLLQAPSGPSINLAAVPQVDQQLGGLAAAPAHAKNPRVLVVGDSVSWSVSVGLEEWGAAHNVDVAHYFGVACGIGGPGVLQYLGIVRPAPPDCATWHQSIARAVKRFRPDVVLVVMGYVDLSPRRFPDGRFANIGDPKFDRFLRDHIRGVTRQLGSSGARVVWASYPYTKVQSVAGATGPAPFVENDPARMDRLNALIRGIVRRMPNTSIVDFAGYSHDRPGGEFDPEYRPDGAHLVTKSTREVAKWLGPQLAALK